MVVLKVNSVKLTDGLFCVCWLDDVEKVIGLLLRESGDRLNERVRNTDITDVLQLFGSYYRTFLC